MIPHPPPGPPPRLSHSRPRPTVLGLPPLVNEVSIIYYIFIFLITVYYNILYGTVLFKFAVEKRAIQSFTILYKIRN